MSHKISLLLSELGSTIGKYVISRIVKNSQSRVGFDGNVCDEENYSHVKRCCGNGCYERSAIKRQISKAFLISSRVERTPKRKEFC